MIDTFHRIRALHDSGVKIHMHCFEYGRPHSDFLSTLCSTVNYYPRRRGLIYQFSLVPYCVITRHNVNLLDDLIRDDHPLFFDGLQVTYLLGHRLLAGRKKIVRLHNREDEYYRKLAGFENNPFKKIYYLLESYKLKWHEKILRKAQILMPISGDDNKYYTFRYGKSEMVLPFHPFDKVESRSGSGEYILFHADLSVNENRVIARYLVNEVFSGSDFRFIIAGKKPPGDLVKLVSYHRNIELIPDPDQERMIDLIGNAHINILPSFSSQGMKLKLILSLYKGRHCLVNRLMAAGTWLEPVCVIADSSEEFKDKVRELMKMPFTGEMISGRIRVLQLYYNNNLNAKIIADLI